MLGLSWLLRRWRGILAAILIVPLVAGVWVVWRASRANQEAAQEIRAKAEFPVRVISLDVATPSGIEPIAAAPGFRDLAAFKDMIAVSARAGLYLYSRNGTLVRVYHTGMELPSAELGNISRGIVAGATGPELFIATHGEGLLAFNGARFRQILPADAGLRTITCVRVLGSGRILMGTESQGVLVFDGRRLTPFHGRLKSAHITALAGDDGNIWIGTLANGVFHYHAGQLDELLDALPDPEVLSLYVDGALAYAGTPLGVVEFRDGQRAHTLADGFFARSLARSANALYVGTEDEGIVDVPLEPHSSAGRGPHEAPICRLANLEGELYAVTDDAIRRYDASAHEWRPVLTGGPTLLADRNIAALAVSGGRLWVGYFDRGVDIVDANLEHAAHHEDDTLFCINRIVTDGEQRRTAVATANGLALFDSAEQLRQVIGRKDGLLSDHVTDAAFREGGMVVATPAGLSFIDRAGIRSMYVFQGLVNNHVYTVATDGAQVAAGTLGGLSMLDDDRVRVNYTTANSHLRHNWITALAKVGGDWFAGTYGAGIERLDAGGEWHSFPDLPSGLVINPNVLEVTGGHVYAGSLGRGLFVYDRASGRWANTAIGLPSENVTALASSGGYLYVGTDNGLVRAAEGALE